MAVVLEATIIGAVEHLIVSIYEKDEEMKVRLLFRWPSVICELFFAGEDGRFEPLHEQPSACRATQGFVLHCSPE